MPKLPRLAQVRESRLLTQKELAQKADVAPSTIARLESKDDEHNTASLRITRKLMEALGVDLGKLTG